ncbi:hypothetical protein ACFXHA_10285 [Nocardia sp. NPDC059240]|uniref:hypothetical protein n=1 Tax=Nocardia sp. NPDC059240 TaxID=3346786 RepID=UPI0036869FA0
MTTALLIAALVVAATAVGLRLSLWRSHPASRAMTITLALLMLGALLTHPTIIASEWLDHATPDEIHLANFSNLIGDLVEVAAAGMLLITVGRAWGRVRFVRRMVGVFAVIAVAMIVLYAYSDAPFEPTRYLGELDGPARVFVWVSAGTVLVANAAVLASLAYSLPVSDRSTRIALLPMMIGAAIGAALMLVQIVGLFHSDPYNSWAWPLAVAMVFAYALSGVLGYFQLRRLP